MSTLARGFLSLLFALVWSSSHAALFDDDEARKAILDLRAQHEQFRTKQEAANAELTKTNAALMEQVTQLRRSLLELNSQIETLRADMAKLRGTDEQLARDIADVQRRQKDISTATQTVDDRIKRLEPIRVSNDGREFMADPEEKRQFDEALASLRGGDFEKASILFGAFVRRYPGSGFADSARFWYGNALYGKRDYKEAIQVFRTMANSAPDHPRAPEALLAIANCQVESRDIKTARATIGELIKVYPKSEAAQAGRERLAALK
ncbi:MAG: tol-pal system protein YbgF [Burkholderiaceae bacterium]|nr:tol-pal system protein YbgF [Burkholderiaceae bacterium]